MQAFLHFKAWQLFLLLFGLPVALQFGVMSALFTGHPGLWAAVGILAVAFLTLGLLLAWLYALGTNLYRRLPATAPMSLNWFRMAALLPVVYLGLLLAYGWNAPRGGAPDGVNGGLTAVLVLLHLSSMACIFYCLYFTAKALKTVERNAPVSLS